MCRQKGKFWNQILIMFYLKVYYLPCLKNLVTREKNESLAAKEKRLAKQRLYGKNVFPQARVKTLAKQRSNKQNESSEAREKRLTK